MIFAAAAILNTSRSNYSNWFSNTTLLILYELSILSVNMIEKKAEQKNA